MKKGKIGLFRSSSQALPIIEGRGTKPEFGRALAERQFSEEFFVTCTGILELLLPILNSLNQNSVLDSSVNEKINFDSLRQSLIKLAPKSGNEVSYSLNPEIIAFYRGKMKFKRFTDMNAFKIVVVKEFKMAIEKIIHDGLFFSLFLQDVIDTLVSSVSLFILESEDRRALISPTESLKLALDDWWNKPSSADMKAKIYTREITDDITFIKDVISKGTIAKLFVQLESEFHASQKKLSEILQFHPANSDLEVHVFHNNARCVYDGFKETMDRLKDLIYGQSSKKSGFVYICDNSMVRYAAGLQRKSETKKFSLKGRERAQSADNGLGEIESEAPSDKEGSSSELRQLSHASGLRLSSQSSSAEAKKLTLTKMGMRRAPRTRPGAPQHFLKAPDPRRHSSRGALEGQSAMPSNQIREPKPVDVSLRLSLKNILEKDPSEGNFPSVGGLDDGSSANLEGMSTH